MTLQMARLPFEIATDRQWTVTVVWIGGLPIAVIDRAASAQLMIELALGRRCSGLPPFIFSSANGQVLSLCARHSRIRDLFLDADLIHANGMPLVFISRLVHKTPLPERVCTIDLFHDVAKVAPQRGVRMFLLGATETAVSEAVQRVQALYPDLAIVGHAGGYLRRKGEEERIIDVINAAQPDILWLGLGAPREQEFSRRLRPTAGRWADQDLRRTIRLPLRQEFAGSELDTIRRARMGLSHVS